MRPLEGVKVVEFAGLAPGPFCGMILSDFGASVIRIDRPHARVLIDDVLCRGKRSAAISVKEERGRQLVMQIIRSADVLIDPYRPGVLEKLGLGPQECAEATNGRLIYARLSGFERTGRYAHMAGHDVNYIALAGVLSMIQPPGVPTPVPPLNIIADFAGGGMLCALGILMALFERSRSGRGQTVECDMVTGSRYLASFPLLLARSPLFSGLEGDMGHLSGAAPWYSVYACKCGGYVAVGAIEPQFYADLIARLGPHLPAPVDAAAQHDTTSWPRLRSLFQQTFASRTRDEWSHTFAGSDSCLTPVLTPSEVATMEGEVPQPAPRLVRTPAIGVAREVSQDDALVAGSHTADILLEMGIDHNAIAALARQEIIDVGDDVRSRL